MTFATSTLASDSPLPIAATISGFTGAWSCTFDQPLAGGALDAGNWMINANDTVFTPSSATAAGSVVSGASTAGGSNPGPNVIAYAPPPFDVLSATGKPAASFSGFPITVT